MNRWVFRIVAALAGTLVGTSIHFAFACTPENVSGWIEVAIASAGLPVLVYELVNLRRITEQAGWRPDIHIGVARHPLSISDIETGLSNEIELVRRSANFYFSLVIYNGGQLAARFVKVHLVFQSYEDKTYIPAVVFPEDNFERKGKKDYIFSGGPGWVVYPSDAEWFHVELAPHPSGEIRSGDYIFQCTVRAEGLDSPATEELIVKITDAQGCDLRRPRP